MPETSKPIQSQSAWTCSDQRRYWSRVALQHLSGKPLSVSDDSFWLECNLCPKLGRWFSKLSIPELPPDEVQQRFTGRFGRNNLVQAFEFYQFASEHSGIAAKSVPRILDFGGGWGRISGFFLRDTNAETIWLSDVLSDSHRWLQKTGAKFRQVKNDPLPPVPELAQGFDLIIAFSVFSHLSEAYFKAWVNYLLSLLNVDGRLVFTSRGERFIDYLPALMEFKITRGDAWFLPPQQEYASKYAAGEFQFYAHHGGGRVE